MKYLSSPSTVNSPGTFMLRKPRLARAGLPKPFSKFTQPAGVPKEPPVQKPKVKMISIGALSAHGLPKIPRLPKL
jgi:hypothetical protein